MKQICVMTAALAALAACTAPSVPDSGAGVGFDNYAQYELERAQREGALAGAQAAGSAGAATTPLGAPAAVSAGPIGVTPNTTQPAISSNALAQAGIGAASRPADSNAPLSALSPQNSNAGAPLSTAAGDFAATAQAAAQNLGNNPELSDEQSFDAVSTRETIESDAQRRAQQAAELVVVEPVPLPAQRAETGVNIVEYAINAPNARGQQWYSRSILSGDTRFQRNCATYNNADEAQRDFLQRGGPDRDSRGVDPDGDGFACGWDPAPFKLAAGN